MVSVSVCVCCFRCMYHFIKRLSECVTILDAVLHGQPHHSVCAHLADQRLSVLPSVGRRRKDHHVHLHPPSADCLPSARVEDSAANGQQHSADRQVPVVHVHHEHPDHPHHRHHHQLELPYAANAPHPAVGASRLSAISATSARHHEAQVSVGGVNALVRIQHWFSTWR